MTTSSQLPLSLTLTEDLVGNRIGAGMYRRWVEGLGLKSTDRVLDVGARGGADARHIAPIVEKGSVTCLEIDGRWLDVARKRLSSYANVDFVEADACEWCEPKRYEVAVMHFVLHDIPAESRHAALSRVEENLIDGGRLCIREPVTRGMSESEMCRLLDEAGFERVGTDAHGSTPFIGQWVSAVWRKPAASLA
jgi:ubiquinone/menaquinone biosynthesis C-methylase UbiE